MSITSKCPVLLHVCSQDIPNWLCLWLFSISSSVFCYSSFLQLSLTFIHCTDKFLYNPQLSCFPLNFPNQITHSIHYTFLDIVPLHFYIPTFVFDCTKFLTYHVLEEIWSDSFQAMYIHLVVCLTTGPKPLSKRALHIVRSRASSFK